MPLISCPKCKTTLRIPDGAVGQVKCPKCSNLFSAAQGGRPEEISVKTTFGSAKKSAPSDEEAQFEIVEEAEPEAKTEKPERTQPKKGARRDQEEDVEDEERPKSAKKSRQHDEDSPRISRKGSDDDEEEERARARKRQDEEDGDEDNDRPRRKHQETGDEDDERPRNRRRRDDDEDNDERPRNRRRRDDDEDDDEDDLPRGKSRRDDDESRRRRRLREEYDDDEDVDDEEEWQPKGMSKKARGQGRVGIQLVMIGNWLYFSIYVLATIHAFAVLMAILFTGNAMGMSTFDFTERLDDSFMFILNQVFSIMSGLAGLGDWIVSLVGFAICIAGPAKGRAMAITATAIASAHLILVITLCSAFTNSTRELGFLFTAQNTWHTFSSLLPELNHLIPGFIFGAAHFSGAMVVHLLTVVTEAVLLFFMLSVIRAIADANKNHDVAARARFGMVLSGWIMGGVLVFLLLVSLLVRYGGMNLKTISILMSVTGFLVSLIYTAMLTVPALTARSLRMALATGR